MRAIANEQLEGFLEHDELECVFVEHGFEDEEVGVQDDGFPVLSVDKSHICNTLYKLVTLVMEEQCKELMKSIGLQI